MKIKTKRLIIREFEVSEKDMNGMYEMFSDVTVNKYFTMVSVKGLSRSRRILS